MNEAIKNLYAALDELYEAQKKIGNDDTLDNIVSDFLDYLYDVKVSNNIA